MNWELITSTLTLLAAGSGLIVWLARTTFSHFLARDVEKYRADLKAAHDTALERLRADLRIQAFEQEITFSRLHDKRVQVIEELYEHIATVSRAMYRLLDEIEIEGGQSLKEQAEAAANAADTFLEYYLKKQIYFDQALCDQLQAFNETMYSAWTDYNQSKLGVNAVARALKFQKACKGISEELPPIRLEIEHEFRKLLGHCELDNKEATK